jgi:hypothetical protein
VPYYAHLPTPEGIRQDRERFLSRPDTPLLDHQRRQAGLAEAAAQLRPPRDGMMIPIGPPVLLGPTGNTTVVA